MTQKNVFTALLAVVIVVIVGCGGGVVSPPESRSFTVSEVRFGTTTLQQGSDDVFRANENVWSGIFDESNGVQLASGVSPQVTTNPTGLTVSVALSGSITLTASGSTKRYSLSLLARVDGYSDVDVPVEITSTLISVKGVSLASNDITFDLDGALRKLLVDTNSATLFDRSGATTAGTTETGITLQSGVTSSVTIGSGESATAALSGDISYDTSTKVYSFEMTVSTSGYNDIVVPITISEIPYALSTLSLGSESLVEMGDTFIGSVDDITTLIDTSADPLVLQSGVSVTATTDPTGINPAISVGTIEYNTTNRRYTIPVTFGSAGSYYGFGVDVIVIENSTYTPTSLSIAGREFTLDDKGNSDASDDEFVYAAGDISDIIDTTGTPALASGAVIVVDGIDENNDDSPVSAIGTAGSITAQNDSYSFTVDAEIFGYAPANPVNVVVRELIRLTYKGDSKLVTHNDKFSIGDIDNRRLFSFSDSSVDGIALTYDISASVDGTTVYSATGESITGASTAVFFGFPALQNDGTPVSTGEDAFNFDEYAGGMEVVIEISDMVDANGFAYVGGETYTMTAAAAGDLYTWRDLQNMRFDLDGEYTVENNIEFPTRGTEGLAASGFTPVGSYVHLDSATTATKYDPAHAFSGSLDGQDHEIVDMSIYRENKENFAGLFGFIGYSGKTSGFIENLHFIDPMVRQKSTNGVPSAIKHPHSPTVVESIEASYIGVLAGAINGAGALEDTSVSDTTIEIEDVSVQYTQSYTSSSDLNAADSTQVFIEGRKYIGALVGLAAEGVTIRLDHTKDYTIPMRTDEGGYVGGIAGVMDDSRVIATGAITLTGYRYNVDFSDSQSLGGVVGTMTDHSVISDTSSRITVKIYDANASSRHAGYAGGVAGHLEGLSVINHVGIEKIQTRSSFSLSGKMAVGAIVGKMDNPGTIPYEEWSLPAIQVIVSGSGSAAIAGLYAGEITGTVPGTISLVAQNAAYYVNSNGIVGGLIGSIEHGTIEDSFFEGNNVRNANLISSVNTPAGGLVGRVTGTVTIRRSGIRKLYSAFDANAWSANALVIAEYQHSFIGGIVGLVENGDLTLEEVFVNAKLAGRGGGLIGVVDHSAVTIRDARIIGQRAIYNDGSTDVPPVPGGTAGLIMEVDNTVSSGTPELVRIYHVLIDYRNTVGSTSTSDYSEYYQSQFVDRTNLVADVLIGSSDMDSTTNDYIIQYLGKFYYHSAWVNRDYRNSQSYTISSVRTSSNIQTVTSVSVNNLSTNWENNSYDSNRFPILKNLTSALKPLQHQ